ncbi:MAG: phasin family protein [Lautropia sp.]
MFTKVEDIVKAQSDLFKAGNVVATTALEGAKKLAELNVQTARSGLETSAEQMKALMNVRDAKTLNDTVSSMLAGFGSTDGNKAAAYAKSVYEISSATGAEVGTLIEQQIAAAQSQVLASVETLAKNAPAGSEGLIGMIKQGVATANGAYEQISQASKQLVSLVDANIAGATKAAAKKR